MSIFKRQEIPKASPEAKIIIVISQFNEEIAERLLNACIKTLKKCGVFLDNVEVVWVPGAFEIPLVCQRIALNQDVHCIITLGAVIKGDTPHFEYVCKECARGIMDVQLKTGLPLIFGVLTCHNAEQAMERSAKNDFNKGHQAAIAAVEIINVLEAI